MKVLVLFESEDEKYVYQPLLEKIECWNPKFLIVSAFHDTLKVIEIVKSNPVDIIFVGSGNSSALAGIVSAHSKSLVLGIPVESRFGGLDSLVSMLQLPHDVPVLTTPAGRYDEAVSFIARFKGGPILDNGIRLVVDSNVVNYEYVVIEMNKAMALCEHFGVKVDVSECISSDKLNVVLVAESDNIYADQFAIHVPVVERTTLDKPTGILTISNWVGNGGLWVGVNNARNAIHAYLRMRNIKL